MIKYHNSDTFHLKFYNQYIGIIVIRPLRIYTDDMYSDNIYTNIEIEPDPTTILLTESSIDDLTISSNMIIGKQKIVLRAVSAYNVLIPFYDVKPETQIARMVPVALAYPKIEFESLTKTKS